MSPESLLLNALKCHLVFAGSLQLADRGRGRGGRLEQDYSSYCAKLFLEGVFFLFYPLMK